MRHTRIHCAGAALLFAACILTAGGARSDEKDKQPDPKESLEQVRKEFTAKFAGRAPDEVLAILNQLANEWPARKGAYEVASQRLIAQAAELDKARQRLGALKEPDAKIPFVLRAADVDPAIKAAQQIADYHTSRVQQLETFKAALDTFQKRLADFSAAMKTANAHLLRMRIAAEIALDTKAITDEKLPPGLTKKQLDESRDSASKVFNDASSAIKSVVDLPSPSSELTSAQTAATAATTKLEELKAGREAALAVFAFEEKAQKMNEQQIKDEFTRLRKELTEKLAALKGDAADYAKAGPHVTEARTKLAAVKEPPVPSEAKPAGSLPPLEEAARQLLAAQQYLGARIRAADERAEKTSALIAALDEQEKKAVAYSTTLEDARRTAAHLAAVATEISRRVGRGDIEVAKAPDGLAEATSASGSKAKLDADLAAVQKALTQLHAERDALRKPDADADNVKALTIAIRGHVTERLDLLADLKKLAADYATARKYRSESDQKRMDQRAVDRAAKEADGWDRFFALDRSKPSIDLSELIDAYYKELIDLDEKEDNLKRQREALTALVEATKKEAADIAKLRAILAKPVESGALDKSEPPKLTSDKIDTEQLRAMLDGQQWDAWLAARVAPPGLKTEAATYHDETARLAVIGGANARRVQALTGNAPPEPDKPAPDQAKQPAGGGEISKARNELFDARVRGLTITGIKIGLVLLAAMILPAFATRVLRRAIRGGTDEAGNPSPVLSALRRVLKLVVWATAGAVILSILGFDVTALVVALAIVALALAVAARPMIADVLGSLAVFADRRFKVGDVVRLGGGEPARVVGLTWRSTALRNNNGLVVSVPNRQMTESTVENLSRGAETYDGLAVTITTDKDAGKVISVIRGAIAQCKNLAQDSGVTVVSYTQRGIVKVVQYRFWWFLKDYEARNKTRDEVFARIAIGLAQEDMTGIEVTLG
jgi:small-conductance mechanosensitive channel